MWCNTCIIALIVSKHYCHRREMLCECRVLSRGECGVLFFRCLYNACKRLIDVDSDRSSQFLPTILDCDDFQSYIIIIMLSKRITFLCLDKALEVIIRPHMSEAQVRQAFVDAVAAAGKDLCGQHSVIIDPALKDEKVRIHSSSFISTCCTAEMESCNVVVSFRG